jgi:acyl CoA:acetate/3-ketoacid CoA transferase alpha subunit
VLDKRMTPKEVIAQIKDGDTIVIGGWGAQRKPMALIREIARSKLKDLTFMSFGGIDIDLLIGAGKVKKLIFPFMSFEPALGAPANYRRARRDGSIEVMELSEYMFIAGIKAAAERLPFYPTRSGLGSDVLKVNPQIVTIKAPYTGEKLVAMPALKADVALIHVNLAERSGWGHILGDPNFDPLISRSAEKVFLCAEKIVRLSELKADFRGVQIMRPWVTGVVEAPYGAHPGESYPEYKCDAAHLGEYAKAAADPEAFKGYLAKYVKDAPDQAAYLKLIGKD